MRTNRSELVLRHGLDLTAAAALICAEEDLIPGESSYISHGNIWSLKDSTPSLDFLSYRDQVARFGHMAITALTHRGSIFGKSIQARGSLTTDSEVVLLSASHTYGKERRQLSQLPNIDAPYSLDIRHRRGVPIQRQEDQAIEIADSFLSVKPDDMIAASMRSKESLVTDWGRMTENVGALAFYHGKRPFDGSRYLFKADDAHSITLTALDSEPLIKSGRSVDPQNARTFVNIMVHAHNQGQRPLNIAGLVVAEPKNGRPALIHGQVAKSSQIPERALDLPDRREMDFDEEFHMLGVIDILATHPHFSTVHPERELHMELLDKLMDRPDPMFQVLATMQTAPVDLAPLHMPDSH